MENIGFVFFDPAYRVYFGIWIFAFGLVFGSFLNCMAMRIVNGEDFVCGHSHCMSCGHTLGVKDLVPLLSWLVSGGKCRYCKARISVRYPLTEMGYALLTEGLYLRYGFSVAFFIFAGLSGCLFVLSLVDFDSFIIPDGTLVAGFLIWCAGELILRPGWKSVGLSFAAGLFYGGAMLVISLIMDRILGRESLGGGDIKLFALLGLYFGFVKMLLLIMLACGIGLIFAVFYQRGNANKDKAFPFGPAIAMAAYPMMIFGDRFAAWYLGLVM